MRVFCGFTNVGKCLFRAASNRWSCVVRNLNKIWNARGANPHEGPIQDPAVYPSICRWSIGGDNPLQNLCLSLCGRVWKYILENKHYSILNGNRLSSLCHSIHVFHNMNVKFSGAMKKMPLVIVHPFEFFNEKPSSGVS